MRKFSLLRAVGAPTHSPRRPLPSVPSGTLVPKAPRLLPEQLRASRAPPALRTSAPLIALNPTPIRPDPRASRVSRRAQSNARWSPTNFHPSAVSLARISQSSPQGLVQPRLGTHVHCPCLGRPDGRLTAPPLPGPRSCCGSQEGFIPAWRGVGICPALMPTSKACG